MTNKKIDRINNKNNRYTIITWKSDFSMSTTEYIRNDFFDACGDNDDLPAKILSKYLKTLINLPKGENLTQNVEKNCVLPYIKEHKK